MSETAGKTYELGGPNIYTRKECYEIMFNIMNKVKKIIIKNRNQGYFTSAETWQNLLPNIR